MANVKAPTPRSEAFILQDADKEEGRKFKLDGSTWVHKQFTGGLMVPGDGQMLFTRNVNGKPVTKNAQEWYEAGDPIALGVQGLQVYIYKGIWFSYQVALEGGCPDPYNKYTWILMIKPTLRVASIIYI